MKFANHFSFVKSAAPLAVAGTLALGAGSRAEAATALYLAYGVDTLESSANFNRIRVRDHHINHYHNFSSNASSPLLLVSGNSVSITLGSMNGAPDSEARYAIPNDGAGSHIHLVLLSLTGPNDESLAVGYGHGAPTDTLAPGGDAHLEMDEPTDLYFSLADGASLGLYTATFQLVDEAGLYLDSPDFTLHFEAIPEPSSMLMAGGALAFGLFRRRR